MPRSLLGPAVVALLVLVACAGGSGARSGDRLASVPDSAWIDLKGPTLIGFYPIVTNAQLDADQDLATVLDDFSYHFGTAADSLTALGFALAMEGGDTIRLRAGRERWLVVRPPDSADVGYLFVDPRGRRALLYGVRTYADLYEDGAEFLRTGRVRPR